MWGNALLLTILSLMDKEGEILVSFFVAVSKKKDIRATSLK